jgi:hypothetical protein
VKAPTEHALIQHFDIGLIAPDFDQDGDAGPRLTQRGERVAHL